MANVSIPGVGLPQAGSAGGATIQTRQGLALVSSAAQQR